jgi:phosphoribosyl 1,2-cyclic phosphodiesterase
VFEIIILGSGSAGNAMLIRSEGATFLVDAGLSAKQLTLRLQACGTSVEQLSGVVLTHEHQDHTSALRVLLARHELPVFCNAMTAYTLKEGGLTHKNWKIFQTGHEFTLGTFTIRPFLVPHDAAEPVGFRISGPGGCMGVLTDLGHATHSIFDALRGVRSILIETNYDEKLLQNDTKRPWSVKSRISSRHGHLSNLAAGKVLAELAAPLEHVIIGHLSRDCNSPDLAVGTVRKCLDGAGYTTSTAIHCASQDSLGTVIQIT